MRYFLCTVLIYSLLPSCKSNQHDDVEIQWSDQLVLPPLNDDVANPGVAGAYAGVYGNYLLIAGGANFPNGLPWEGGKKVYHKTVYVYHLQEGGWLFSDTLAINTPRGYGASLSLSEGVLCMGGENSEGILEDAMILNFDSVGRKLSTQTFPGLPAALTNFSAVRVGEEIYIAGGESNGGVSNKMFMLSLSDTASGWHELSPVPKRVSNFVMVALRDRILIIGGRCRQSDGISKLYNTVYSYDIRKDSWTKKKPLPYALSAGTGIQYTETEVLLFGGDRGETFHKTEMIIKEIGEKKDSSKKVQLVEQKNQMQAHHPGFSNVILHYDAEKDQWREAGEIPFDVPVTTTVVRFGDQVILASGEVRAGVRTPHILIGQIKSK